MKYSIAIYFILNLFYNYIRIFIYIYFILLYFILFYFILFNIFLINHYNKEYY